MLFAEVTTLFLFHAFIFNYLSSKATKSWQLKAGNNRNHWWHTGRDVSLCCSVSI